MIPDIFETLYSEDRVQQLVDMEQQLSEIAKRSMSGADINSWCMIRRELETVDHVQLMAGQRFWEQDKESNGGTD